MWVWDDNTNLERRERVGKDGGLHSATSRGQHRPLHQCCHASWGEREWVGGDLVGAVYRSGGPRGSAQKVLIGGALTHHHTRPHWCAHGELSCCTPVRGGCGAF
jgi:hypothetical protein